MRGQIPKRRNKRVSSTLERLFPNPALLDVLALLVLNPGQEFYQSEIAERTSRTVLQVQRALLRIRDAGLVTERRRGNRVYYTANREHPAFEDLKRVLLKTVGLGDLLRETLVPLGEKIRIAFIYGSIASGSESPSSDVDLLLVGNLTAREASRVLGSLGRDVQREFNPIVYPPEEFREKAKRGNRFVTELLRGPKIWLLGDEHELGALVE